MTLTNPIVLDEVMTLMSKIDEDDFAIFFAQIINRACKLQEDRIGEGRSIKDGTWTCIGCRLNCFSCICRGLHAYVKSTEESLFEEPPEVYTGESMRYSQAVKTRDFDSLTVGSNPTTSASHGF